MRFWVLVFLVVGLVALTPRAKAQTPITSQNILTPTVDAWTGSVAGQNGGYSGGGNGPAFNAGTNTLIFGYTTATATQRITAEAFAIQHALDLSNSGIKINGYNYSWQINNSGEQSGTLTGQVNLLRGTSVLRTDIYNYNTPTNGFQLYSGTQTFVNQESILAGDSMTLSFTGKDSRFWAGYYGPQVRNPSITLNYTTDPCAGNPAYSPSCSGYNTVVTSPNLLTGMTGPQAYAINQALSNAGAGAMIHGFNYGYDYSVAGRTCSFFDLFGFCLTGWQYSDAGVATVITDSNNSTIYSSSNTHNGGDNGTFGTYSKQFRFGTSRQITTLGGFAMAPWTSGNASITNMYSNAVYTADPCLDPLSSPSCSGYAAAYFTQQCTANPLYNSACPGYAQAYFTQQCTVNAMFDPACPGYASAYLTYQCSINPLYSTTCAGYAEAYKTQQCALDGLYDRTCTNYADAYARKYVIGIPSSGTISYGPADSRCTVGCDTSNTLNTNAGPATSGYSGPGATNVSTTQPVTSISNSGQISTGVAVTNDSNVNAVIATPKMDGPAASTGNSPVASSMNSPGPAASGSSTQTANAGPATRQEQKSEDKRDDAPKGTGGNNSPQTTNTAQASSDKPAAPTARQAIQERREAAAKAEAVEKGKNLANEMGKASDMESQKQVQNVVIQAMGFTPGFDTYGKAMLPDVAGYKPYSVYNNQKTIDNRANLRMFGGTDRIHNEMVNSQYNKGN
jgi:hypothetical protein